VSFSSFFGFFFVSHHPPTPPTIAPITKPFTPSELLLLEDCVIGTDDGVGLGRAVGLDKMIDVNGFVVGRGVTGAGIMTDRGACMLPTHSVMELYWHEEPVQPSLQITAPFGCAPALQLTPPRLPEQHPLVAKTTENGVLARKTVLTPNKKRTTIQFTYLLVFIESSFP
jgi:hypothetical protein